MFVFSLVAAILAVPASAGLATTQVASKGDHPAVKIIALLEKLSSQVKEEGEAEAVEYAKFTMWCGGLIEAKEKAIATHTTEVEVATASISSLTEDISALEGEIAALAIELTADEASKAAAISQRDSDNTDYVAAKADIESTISALDEAITALDGSKADALTQVAVKKGLELIKIYAPNEVKAAKKVVKAFLQSRQDPELNEPTVKTYDFKSGGVIETLETLKTKFEDDLKDANTMETNAADSHTLAVSAKQDEIDSATAASETKTSVKARKGQDLASAETDLQESTDARATADTVLHDTKTTCTTRASQWEERSSRREGEVKAMAQAVEILTKVTGVRTPDSKGVATSFSFIQKSDDPQAKIVNLLRKAAGKSKGKQALAKLADQIAELHSQGQMPGSGIFDQIKNMIEKMVFHLMSEQKDEDDHKNWCDMEIQKTDKMKEDKETKRDELEVDIDSLTAEIATLTAGIKQNTDDCAVIEAQIEEETSDRNAAKAENTATIKDAQDAQSAVTNAIGVLEDFYKSTGGLPKEDWELVQTKVVRRAGQDPEEPVPFSADAYTGGGGSDVVGMLSDIASDFSSMEAEAKNDEVSQQDEYDTWLTTATADKAEKEKDTEMKDARKERQGAKLAGKQTDSDHNTKELEATNTYLANLQPACVNGDSTYEDRKGARTQEIEALKQAQLILQTAFEE